MAQRKGCEGIIEDVILLGTPVSASADQWKPFARIVSGRIINGYCRGDWLLKFLYRTSSATLRIAGLQAINWDNRKMINIDLSDIVSLTHSLVLNSFETTIKLKLFVHIFHCTRDSILTMS
jgi:hypothetical protein